MARANTNTRTSPAGRGHLGRPARAAGAVATSGPYRLSASEMAEANELHARAERDIERELDAYARYKHDVLLARLEFPDEHASGAEAGGGYAGDVTRPATDLLRLATWCAAGDAQMRQRALGYLRRANAHQRAHLAHLRAGGIAQNDANGAGPARTRGAIVSALELCDRNDVAEIGVRTRDAERARLRERRANQEFDRLILAGRLGVAHRLATLSAQTREHRFLNELLESAQITELMDNCVRICRAEAALTPDDARWPLNNLSRYTDDYLTFLRPEREPGADINSFHLGGSDVAPVGVMHSVGQVMAAARAMLRNPHAHTHGPGSLDDGVGIWVAADIATLRELCDTRAGDRTWIGMVISDRSAHPGVRIRQMWLEAHMGVDLGGRGARLIVETLLGDAPAMGGQRLREWAAERHPDLADQIAGADHMRRTDRPEPEGAPRLIPARVNVPSGRATITALLGHERCRHEDAAWVSDATRAQEPASALRLRCPSCHRSRVAVAPLHRLPEQHPARAALTGDTPAARDARERYLRRERYHAALRDDERPILSVEQLAARDGAIDLTPAAYAIGGTGASDGPVRRPVRSIAEAMRRR